MTRRFTALSARSLGLLLAAQILFPARGGELPPNPLPGLRSTNEFFPGSTYRAAIPSPDQILGFPLAERATTSTEVERCLKAWTAAAPDRSRLVEYARSHENRPLHYVVVTAPANFARLDEIQAGIARLGDPRAISEAEAETLIRRLPAVAWLAYTIHGDETEGSDAALVVLHHLLAAEDSRIAGLLSNTVVVIDPLMNPDGRDRFLQMITEHRGASPNVDDQSLLHAGYWPRGRGNHYLFDLNRDWIYGVHPETRGRLRAVRQWNPQLFVDAHGMGPQDTHLFSPPREPINRNIPPQRDTWSQLFGREQARAFDRERLLYYTGEWHEEWYPGYSDAWASYLGAVGILYEQARVAEDAVRRPEGRLLSYRESVRHHVIGTLSNLGTLEANRQDLLRYFHECRRQAVATNGPFARRTFAVLPTANLARRTEFIRLLQLEGIELFQANQTLTAAEAVNFLGATQRNVTLPPGTLLIPNRQPLGHLAAALLEFDPQLDDSALAEERKELLQNGRTRIYDVTAWNLTMMFGLPALTLAADLPAGAAPLTQPPAAPPPLLGEPAETVGFVIDGADDRSVAAAARLMERGVQVRTAEKVFRFDEREFARGSILITPLDNRAFAGDLTDAVRTTAAELGLTAVAVRSGFGPGELPDIGGDRFTRLEPPRIALWAREGISSQDYGAIWFAVDHHLGIRHSQLGDLHGQVDLSRYNVLVIPQASADVASSNQLAQLRDWVRAGGTLIAVGNAATALTAEKADFSKARLLPDVLGQLAEYEVAVLREWLGTTGRLPSSEDLWGHRLKTRLDYPWPGSEGAFPDEKELKRREAWQRLFMPQGTFLAGRVNTNHWLTAGCEEMMPVLADKGPVLMAAGSVQAPIRYGHFVPAETSTPPEATAPSARSPAEAGAADATASRKDKKEAPRAGWCVLPPGTDLQLRLSGLLWPEATHRLANAAWVTREPLGRGQIILFASPPAFRGAARGSMRVLLNAMVCGPGCGTAPVIRP